MTEFVILVASMMSIVALSIDTMMPALGIIGGELGTSFPNQTQFIISFIFMGMATGQLVCGPLSDALGRKKVLYGGLVIFIIGSLICYFANSIEMLLFGRVVQGLGVSAPYVSAVAIVRDKFAGRDMARIMSLVMMIFILVPAVAPSIGLGILYLSDWRGIFAFFVLYGAGIAAWMFLRLEETLKPENRIPFNFKAILNGYRIVFKTRVTVCYMIAMGIMFGSLIGYLNSCQQIFQEQFKVGDAFALYFGGLALTIGAASLLNSKIVHKYGMRAIVTRAVLSIITVSAIFLAVNLMVEVQLWMFLLFAAVLFFSFGLLFGNLNSIAMEPMGHIAGIAAAVIGSTSSIISLVLGSTIGQMYDGTLIPIVSGFLGLNLITLLMIRLAGK